MWKGRDMLVCALAFLAGDFFGGWVTLPPESYLVAATAAAVAAVLFSSKSATALRSRLTLLLALFLLGAAATQIGRMPPAASESALRRRCGRMKEDVSDFLGTIIEDGDELAVLKALAIGDRSELPRELRDSYKRSGAMHLLALSGLHVGIIYKLLGYMLFLLEGLLLLLKGLLNLPFSHGGLLISSQPADKRLRWIRSAVIVLTLWLFAMVSGLSPSIARAVLMITVYELAPFFGARRDGLTALAVAAVVITLSNPEAPRQVSFQLSFSACVAIFTIFPRMRRFLTTSSRILTYVWDCLSLAVSCQLFTGPISFFYFGTFPKYFLVTNLLTVPLVGVIMYLIAAAVIMTGVTVLGPLSASVLREAVHLLNYLVSVISSL